jgi:hypothetical protein
VYTDRAADPTTSAPLRREGLRDHSTMPSRSSGSEAIEASVGWMAIFSRWRGARRYASPAQNATLLRQPSRHTASPIARDEATLTTNVITLYAATSPTPRASSTKVGSSRTAFESMIAEATLPPTGQPTSDVTVGEK